MDSAQRCCGAKARACAARIARCISPTTRRFRVGLPLTFAILLVSGCASSPVPAGADSDWVIEGEAAKFPYGKSSHAASAHRGVYHPPGEQVVAAFLHKDNAGNWKALLEADPNQLGVEAIWLDGETRRVGLAALGTARNTDGKGQAVCNLDVSGDRRKTGYSLCNSELTTTVKDLGLIFTPIKLIPGLHIAALKVDRDKMAAALDGIDLSDLHAAAYGREMALEKSAHDARTAQLRERELQRANAEKLWQLQLANAEKLRQQQLRTKGVAWQNQVSRGDESVCGLVVEVKRPIALVQFVEEQRWVQIDKLYPRSLSNLFPQGAERIVYCKSL